MILAEPVDLRLLVVDRGAVVVAGKQLVRGDDAAYSPDGTFVAFVRAGDLWLANSDGTGQRRLAATPNIVEWGPTWLPDGKSLVFTAEMNGARTIRVYRLPKGPSKKLADGTGADVSGTGKLAYVAPDGTIVAGGQPFSTTTYTDVRDLAWSPDGTKLAYSATLEAGLTTAIVVDHGTTQAVGPAGAKPVWSPNGNRIAFTAGGRLQSVAAADFSDLRQLGAGTPVDWAGVPSGRALWPNLVQRPPSGLVLTRAASGRWSLGFISMVDQRGPGWLRIIGTRKSMAKRIMDVQQFLQLANGRERALPDSGRLRYVVAPPHYHWHLLGFDHYELRNAGDFKLRVRDYKSGFCIADRYGAAIGVPRGPPRWLGNCEQLNPRALRVEQGSSVGYTDRYLAFFHGQQLDITKLKPGDYWLVHRANEDFTLRERRYDDNAASLLIRLSWRGGTPSISTLRTCSQERC